jgi:hypothetical protein
MLYTGVHCALSDLQQCLRGIAAAPPGRGVGVPVWRDVARPARTSIPYQPAERWFAQVAKIRERYGLEAGPIEYRPELWEGEEQGEPFPLQ